jgi:integrase
VGFHRRPYDCRVTAVTRSLTSGKVSITAAQRLFGHVSQKMQKRYYKPDMDVLREAVEVLESPAKKPLPACPCED